MGQAKRMWESYLGLWERLTGWKRVLFCLFHYTLLFSITFLLAYSPFFRAGKSFIWIGDNSDGRAQHYPTLVYVGRYLRQIVLNLFHGELSIPLFDLNLAMGGDMIATLNYYGFGNPLYLLSAFVPTHYTEYLYNVLIVVRLYLAGLSFLALCRYHKKEFPYALIGTLVYVFSGYAMFSVVRHPYFVEPMIQLPLLLIGIDLVIRKKKPFVFILTVFYSALCGFYFLYMMTIMLGLYTLVRFFDCYKESRVKKFFSMAGRIMGTYLLGIGLAAPIFVPAVMGFLASARSGGVSVERNYFSYGLKYYKTNFLKLIAPPGSYNALSVAAIVLLALVALFVFQKKRCRSLKLLLLACGVIYIFPAGGYMMNGFAYPSQRWTFGFALLLSYILVEMLPELLQLNRKQQLLFFVVFLMYSFAVFWKGKYRTDYHLVGVSMLAATLLVLCLFGAQNGTGKNGKRIGAIACAFLVLFNVSINGVYKFSKNHANYIGEFTTYGTETKRLETVLERMAESYLVERDGRFSSSSFSENVGAVWQVPTLSTFWSITNEAVSDLWSRTENIDQRSSSYTIDGTDQRAYMDALLSMKYFVDKSDRTQYVPYGYSLLEEAKDGILVYENQYALPWGYTYDSYFSYDAMQGLNGLETEEAMLQSIVLEDSVDAVPKAPAVQSNIQKVPYEIAQLNDVEWENGILTVSKNDASIILEFQTPVKAETYLRLQGFDINNSGQSSFTVFVICDNIQKSCKVLSSSYTWYFGRENYLVNLGYSEEEHTTCAITFPKKGTYKLDDIQLLALPMDKYPEQVEALRAEPLENIVWETNKVSGTVDLSKNKILCMSIPYSKGWTAKVDGQKTKILKGNYMFMALPLSAGHHDIEFTYCTPGLKAGVAASLLSVGALICLVYRERKKRQVL